MVAAARAEVLGAYVAREFEPPKLKYEVRWKAMMMAENRRGLRGSDLRRRY